MKFNSLVLEEKRKREISLQSQQTKGVLFFRSGRTGGHPTRGAMVRD